MSRTSSITFYRPDWNYLGVGLAAGAAIFVAGGVYALFQSDIEILRAFGSSALACMTVGLILSLLDGKKYKVEVRS